MNNLKESILSAIDDDQVQDASTSFAVGISNSTEMDQALAEQNITAQVIASIREKYLPLKVDDPTDNKAYKLVKEARLHCKNLRVMAQKICKAGRAEAKRIQEMWIAKEKEVVSQISAVEEHLEAQELWVEQERQRMAREAEEKRKEEARKRLVILEARQRELAELEVNVSIAILDEMSDDAYSDYLREAKLDFYWASKIRQWQPDFLIDELYSIKVNEGEMGLEARLERAKRQHELGLLGEQRHEDLASYNSSHPYTVQQLWEMDVDAFQQILDQYRVAHEKARQEKMAAEAAERLKAEEQEKEVQRLRQELEEAKEAARIAQEARDKAMAELTSKAQEKEHEMLFITAEPDLEKIARLSEDDHTRINEQIQAKDEQLLDTLEALDSLEPVADNDPLKQMIEEAYAGSKNAQLLYGAVIMLSTQYMTDKTPHQILDELEQVWYNTKDVGL